MTVPQAVKAIVDALPPDDPRRAPFVGDDGKPLQYLLYNTGRRGLEDANIAGATVWTDWGAKIAALRGLPPPDDLDPVLDLIEEWRRNEVERAQAYIFEIALHDLSSRGRSTPQTPGLDHGGVRWAQSYFAARPEASRDVQTPAETFMLIDRLREAAAGREAWREVEGFDDAMAEAVALAWRDGIERPSPGPRAARAALPPRVRDAARPAFAKAWWEVERAREVERHHAAAIFAMIAGPDEVPERRGAYRSQPGDKTVGELLDAYQAAKPSKNNVAPARALREFIGERTPVRAVTREDARRFAQFVPTLPANAAKLYKGLSMVEAAERAEADRAAGGKRPVLSPTSAKRYLTYAAMFWNWGLGEGDGLWADRNPFKGLAKGGDTASTDRRSFTDAELVRFFNHLSRYKAKDSYLFWAPALALNGARLAEVCQLRTDDVREVEGVPYLKFHLFDAAGRRDPMKGVKNIGSVRDAPIHPLVIKAGFLDFVERRRAAGAERLFGDAKPYWNKRDQEWDWSHYPSRALNKAIDAAVTEDPAVVFHSFRHGVRTRARNAGLNEEVIDGIGGWSQKTVGRRYGEMDVPMLAANLARLDYGALKL